jgi:hypothetical protein
VRCKVLWVNLPRRAGRRELPDFMNRALREFMENKAIEGKVESLEKMLRRVIEEVIPTPPVARM